MKSDDFFRSDGRYYDVNFFEYHPASKPLGGRPASALFAHALNLLPYTAEDEAFARHVRRRNGINTTLWGVRKEANKYSLELYFYYPIKYPQNSLASVLELSSSYLACDIRAVSGEDEKNIYLTSVNLEDGKVVDANFYHSLLDESSDCFYFEDKGLVIDRWLPTFCSYSLVQGSRGPERINTYWGYFDDGGFEQALAKLKELVALTLSKGNLNSADNLVEDVCRPYGDPMSRGWLVASKQGAVGVYFLGLDIDVFLKFLAAHDYEADFIACLEEEGAKYQHIKFDIGIDFFSEAGSLAIKKTAFWGSF